MTQNHQHRHGETVRYRENPLGDVVTKKWFQPDIIGPGRWVTPEQWEEIYNGTSAKPQDGSTVTGYRTLNSDVTDQMNRLKEISRTFLQELDAMKAGGECDPVWLDMAKRDMQTACMFACRAVAKPSDDC